MLPPICEAFLHQLVAIENKSPSTRDQYARDLALWTEFLARQQVDVLAATRRHIKEWLLEVSAKRQNSPATLRRKIACLRSFYKWAVREEYIPHSPAEGIDLPKLEKRKAIYLRPFEVRRLLAAVLREPDTAQKKEAWARTWRRDLAMIRLMLYQGLRIGEVVALDWSNVDFENGIITVFGKGRKERRLPLHPVVYEDLKGLQEHGPTSPTAVFVTTANPNPAAPPGQRLGHRAARDAIKKYIQAAALSAGVTSHKLRHTFATTLLNAGADIRDVAEQLGHSSLEATKIYTHATALRQRELVERVRY